MLHISEIMREVLRGVLDRVTDNQSDSSGHQDRGGEHMNDTGYTQEEIFEILHDEETPEEVKDYLRNEMFLTWGAYGKLRTASERSTLAAERQAAALERIADSLDNLNRIICEIYNRMR